MSWTCARCCLVLSTSLSYAKKIGQMKLKTKRLCASPHERLLIKSSVCILQFENNHKIPSLFSISSTSFARQNICVKLFSHILLPFQSHQQNSFRKTTAQHEVVYASRRPPHGSCHPCGYCSLYSWWRWRYLPAYIRKLTSCTYSDRNKKLTNILSSVRLCRFEGRIKLRTELWPAAGPAAGPAEPGRGLALVFSTG